MEKKQDTAPVGPKVTSYTEQEVPKEKGGFVAYHSFEAEELNTFLAFINDVLKDDADVKPYLPLANEDALIKACADGILLCKLINAAVPGTIDDRTINHKSPLNVYQKTENLRLAINAAVGIGCRIINITPQFIMEGKLHLIMGMVWQIMQVYLFKEINLKTVPEIIVLAEAGEKMEDMLKLPSEKILVRWINYHLKAAKQSTVIKEIGPELKDCKTFLYLLNQLDPEKCSLAALSEGEALKRAAAVAKYAQAIGVKSFPNASALVQGNAKLYTIFCCLTFNVNHGLKISQEKKKEVEKATMLEDAKGATKEERTYQLWMNSMGLETPVNNIYTDLRDGLSMIKILKSIWPEVPEGRYEKTPGTNRFKMIANGNYIVEHCKKQKLVLTGIGGMDIVDGKPTQLLGLIWQLMRANYLQIVGGKSDEELVAWANKMVNKPPGIKNFRDPTLKNSKFLINLLAAVEPDIVDWSLVKDGANDEEISLNARYCISIARKLGAKIFLTWEDIKTVLLQ